MAEKSPPDFRTTFLGVNLLNNILLEYCENKRNCKLRIDNTVFMKIIKFFVRKSNEIFLVGNSGFPTGI